MNDKIIGIIGGMGPEATADFYMRLIRATNVRSDQEHFRVIMDSNPKIPDRTSAIFGAGESPVKALVETAKNLERCGVEVACIPCVTAHYFIEEIQKEVSYPILNALVELDKYIAEFYPDVTKIGVLATSGTVRTGLFQKYVANVSVIYPDADIQENKVMKAIYGDNGIKSGNTGDEPAALLKEAAMGLIEKGAQLIVLGCTEIPLALKQSHLPIPLINPMDVVALAVVK